VIDLQQAQPLLRHSGRMSRTRVALGLLGETLACAELERRGYAILTRRYRRRGGEIDIVARDGPTTVFVEVKTRTGRAFGAGGDAVTGTKQRRIVSCAADYLARNGLTGRPCRFDVVAIDVGGPQPVVEVYTDAFDAGR
jgi:putative endonuclease